LQRPEILILDEPTSALDSESEQFIQHALERLHGEVTLLVIAHRLATVEKADQILVLADGRIVEAGTHDDLLARGGHYERLFASQIRA
jgi:ABC-type multidrug transport system fused ATPase/permease subunit